MTAGSPGPGGRGLRPRDVEPFGVVVREGFFDQATLARLRGAMAAEPGELAAVRDDEGTAANTEARVAWEVSLPEDLDAAIVGRINAIRPALEEAAAVVLEPCDAVAALRYPAGAFYGPHRDVSDTADEHGLHRRVVSIVIFLNDGDGATAEFGGGRLRLFELEGPDDDGRDVVPEAGTLVAFPSRLRHEVTPVTWGERYVLATWLLVASRPERTDFNPGGDGDGRSSSWDGGGRRG